MGLFSASLSKLDPLLPACSEGASVREVDNGGVVLGVKEDGAEVRIPLSRFAQHLVVSGGPGMRKTTLVSGLADQLANRGVSVVVLEPAKAEYGRLLTQVDAIYGAAGFPDVKPLKINPFLVDKGVRIGAWIEDLSAAIADSYGASKDPSGPLYLEGLVRRLYRAYGVKADDVARAGVSWPTVKTYLDEIDGFMRQECCSGKEVMGNIRGFLTRRGRSMASCSALVSNRGPEAEGLMAPGVTSVAQLCDFGRGSGRLLGMVILLRIMSTAKTLGCRSLHTVVILEEAHSVFVDELSGEPTMFSRLYESALAELRASGVGFVTVDQRPGMLPAGVLANSVTKVAFASAHGDDRDAIKRAMGLDEMRTRRFGSLHAGEALFSTVGSNGAEVISACGKRGDDGRHGRRRGRR